MVLVRLKPVLILLALLPASACKEANFAGNQTTAARTADPDGAKDDAPVGTPASSPATAVTPASVPAATPNASGTSASVTPGATVASGSVNGAGTTPAVAVSTGTGTSPVTVGPPIPGIPATKVGINFEDTRGGDADYNDAVLCFVGNFAVDGSNVVSTSQQTVIGSTYSHALCHHEVTIVIVAANGSRTAPFQYDSRSTETLSMSFDVGSRLELTMVSMDCDAGIVKSMHNPQDAQVAPNVCRTSGH